MGGDGTTSVVVFAGELLREAKRFLEDGLPPQTVTKGFRKASQLALGKLHGLAYDLGTKTQAEKEDMFRKCAETTLNSKLISGHKAFFAEMVTKAVMTLGEGMPLKMIGIKKVTGGAVTDSQLVQGVAFKKTFSYAGLELELKAEKDNAEVRLSNPDESSRSLTPSGGSS